MRCLISPSPALSSASMTVRPPNKLPTTICQVNRPAPSFMWLKLRRRPSETVALRPRCLVVWAQMNHDHKVIKVAQPNHFVKELKTIMRRSNKLYDTDEGLLHHEALDTSVRVCILAVEAVIMASQLVDSVSMTATCLYGKICIDTVHMTLATYVDIFLNVSKDCYNRTFDRDTVLRFVDALRGLGSISHIMLEDALEALNHTHPREGLLEHAFNSDVDSIHRDFSCQIDDLEDNIWNPKTRKPVELVIPTIYEGIKVTKSFLGLMEARRQRILETACGGSK